VWTWPLVIASLFVGAGVAARTWRSAVPAEQLVIYGTVPDFSLLERSGRSVTRSDLLGKVSVVDVFYTRCPDACPLQSAHLAKLQGELSGVRDALLVSITVDPDHDTPAVLASYAARFHADPRHWLFLTGPRDAIYRLAVDGFHLAAVASGPVHSQRAWTWLGPQNAWAHDEPAAPKVLQLVHASRFALIDRHARIRGYFDGTDWDAVKRLHNDFMRLLRER
jgi:protein SCO1/2